MKRLIPLLNFTYLVCAAACVSDALHHYHFLENDRIFNSVVCAMAFMIAATIGFIEYFNSKENKDD